MIRGVPIITFLCALLGSLAPGQAQAGDVRAGRQKAVACAACHGLDGLSKQPDAPTIAAHPEAYFIKAIREYREGLRRHEQMTIVARGLSEADIADLAAYFGAIQLEATVPAR